jgi:hypothetical protein
MDKHHPEGDKMRMERFNGKRWELFGPVITGEIHD